MVGAVGLVAANDLRRRARRVLLVTVLVGIVGAFTLSAAAGARRSSSALARFRAQSLSADIAIDGAPTPAQLQTLARVPGVAAVGTLRAWALVVPAAPDFQQIGAPFGAGFGSTVDRDRIVDGRAPDPAAVDEITLGEGFADRLRVHAGDHLDSLSFSPAQIAANQAGEADVGVPAGPRLRLHVVGIVRRPLDLGEQSASGGLLLLTPAFDRAYAGRIGVFGTRVRIRTVDAPHDVAAVIAASRRIFGSSLFNAQSLAIESQGARNAIDVIAVASWIAAAVAALAGAIAIVIVLSREISSADVDQRALRALGCTRRQRVAMYGPSAIVVAAGGALLAGVGAVAVSPMYPFGVARRAEPSAGVHADWIVLGLGVVGIVMIVSGIAFAAALRATRQSAPDSLAGTRSRKATVVQRISAAGFAPSLTNGLRMAVEPGKGRAAVPVRSAFLGAVSGVLGVTAVLVFTASLGHLVDTPRLYGSTWDFKVADTTLHNPCRATDYGLARDPGIGALAEVCAQNVQVDGRPAGALAFTQLRGDPIQPVVLAGRAPNGDREVALGSKTLHALDKHVGDAVRVTSRTADIEFRIVGRVVLPTLGPSQLLADGVAFTGAGYAPLFDRNLFFRYFVGTYSPGADPVQVGSRIDTIAQLGASSGPTVPVEIDRLRQIGWLPKTLAGFVGGLALLAVGHAIVTAVRRRRRELAIFKSLGFSRRQVRATVDWQATTLGAVGVVIGVPAGIVVGRIVWGAVSGALGVSTSPAAPAIALVLTALGALALVNVVAFLPGRAASRMRTAWVLRSE